MATETIRNAARLHAPARIVAKSWNINEPTTGFIWFAVRLVESAGHASSVLFLLSL